MSGSRLKTCYLDEWVLYRYRSGIPWRDLPERFGDFRVVHTLLGAAEPAIRAGAFGFNNVLTALAFFGGLFRLNTSSAIYGTLAVIVTSFMYAALSAALEPLGMPAMTLAFIVTVWLFILAQRNFSRIRLISSS